MVNKREPHGTCLRLTNKVFWFLMVAVVCVSCSETPEQYLHQQRHQGNMLWINRVPVPGRDLRTCSAFPVWNQAKLVSTAGVTFIRGCTRSSEPWQRLWHQYKISHFSMKQAPFQNIPSSPDYGMNSKVMFPSLGRLFVSDWKRKSYFQSELEECFLIPYIKYDSSAIWDSAIKFY